MMYQISIKSVFVNCIARGGVGLITLLLAFSTGVPVVAQSTTNETTIARNDALDLMNPLAVLQQAARAIPMTRMVGNQSSAMMASDDDVSADPRGGLSVTLSILVLLTVLSIAPSLLVMTTSFTRIVVVLSLLRQAIGTQSLPPSQVIVGLSLFTTFLVMGPTFEKINKEAIVPLHNGEISQIESWEKIKGPLNSFMFDQIDYAGNWPDVEMLLAYRQVDPDEDGVYYKDQVDMLTLIPAFMLSELKVAFLMGFRLYLPFLIVDMVVASVLISMGMLMLPPILISLPFKLLLFVLVDGWQLVAGNLLSSFAISGVTT